MYVILIKCEVIIPRYRWPWLILGILLKSFGFITPNHFYILWISNLSIVSVTWWRLFQKRVVHTKFDIYVLYYWRIHNLYDHGIVSIESTICILKFSLHSSRHSARLSNYNVHWNTYFWVFLYEIVLCLLSNSFQQWSVQIIVRKFPHVPIYTSTQRTATTKFT